MFSKSLSSFLVFSVFTSRPRSQLSHGGALIMAVLPSRVFIFSTVPHYILCMLVPYLFELPPQFLCSPFLPHPALSRSVWGMAHTRPKSHRLWHVASSLDSPRACSALGPSPCLCLGSGAFQVMPSGFVPQLLSSPWLLLVSLPASMIPGAVAGLCPPPSLCTGPPCLGP